MTFQNLPFNGFFFFFFFLKPVTAKFIISISADLQLYGFSYKTKLEFGMKMSHSCSLAFSKTKFHPN